MRVHFDRVAPVSLAMTAEANAGNFYTVGLSILAAGKQPDPAHWNGCCRGSAQQTEDINSF